MRRPLPLDRQGPAQATVIACMWRLGLPDGCTGAGAVAHLIEPRRTGSNYGCSWLLETVETVAAIIQDTLDALDASAGVQPGPGRKPRCPVRSASELDLSLRSWDELAH